MSQTKKTLSLAALSSGVDEKTARKYLKLGKLPGEVKSAHTWRTRKDPFEYDWEDVKQQLGINPGLEPYYIFNWLQRKYPGKYSDGQLRTLQRRIKQWRATEGLPKEVFFPQEHKPGVLCESDFTHMLNLKITIQGRPFKHLLYHFVLTYSNWETGMICYSESFESLSEGLQNALWELGGVPEKHRTDRLTVAVQKTSSPNEFTARYEALLKHYGLKGCKTQSKKPNENGDVEQRHYRFKKALEQSLLLRGSRDFEDLQEYDHLLKKLFKQLNMGRSGRFKEELSVLRRLPYGRLESCKRLKMKVGPSSTIRVNHNVYSVDSRLIKEQIEVRLYMEHLEIWYAQRCVERIPRVRGEQKDHIQYRHVIDTLVRKPGAFERYRYRDSLFPSSFFRIAYDNLKKTIPKRCHKEYLKILHLAAKENEGLVEMAIKYLLNTDQAISFGSIEKLVVENQTPESARDVKIDPVNIYDYDALLSWKEADL